MFESRWQGQLEFADASQLQKALHRDVLAGGEGVILGLEHAPVITLGIRGRPSEDVAPSSVAEGPGLPVIVTDRGGQATLHSPGQLVIYPILPFKRWGLPPRQYVSQLLETTAQTLREFGIECEAREDRAGVYTLQGKIAFCGLRLEHGVSRHGLSINVSNDLALFQGIRPCGRSQESLTRAQDETKAPVTPQMLFEAWIRHFKSSCQAREGLLYQPARSLGAVGSAFP